MNSFVLDMMEQSARELVEQVGNGVNRAYVGERNGEPCVICVVEKKKPTKDLAADVFIPRIYSQRDSTGNEHRFRTRVEEGPVCETLQLYVSKEAGLLYAGKQSSDTQNLQSCHDFPLRGGVQIAPLGAGWVGTLGGACVRDAHYGLVTNYHVANGGEYGKDAAICQPHGSGPRFGEQSDWVPIRFDDSVNLVDCSFVRSENLDKKQYGVIPEQVNIGKINPHYWDEADVKLGMKVQKVGRTTGHTRGEIVGVRSTSYVSYGQEGTAKFEKQFVVRGLNGSNFSAGGDSGSLVLDMDNRPVGLLFAGGGSDTIINPIEFVVSRLKVKFFS